MKNLILSLFIVGLLGCAKERPSYERIEIKFDPVTQAEFEELTVQLDMSNVNPDITTSLNGGSVAHSQYYILHDLIDRLQYQGDTSVIPKIEMNIERILKGASNNKYDVFRKRVPLGFTSDKYTDGKNYTWGFHVHKALEPIARYQVLMGQDTSETLRILMDFDGDWNGTMYEEPYLGKASPFNMNAHMVMTLNMLGADRGRMVTMGQYFKNHLYFDYVGGNQFLMWRYNSTGKRKEDAQHAVSDLKLVVRLFEQGKVFNQRDLEEMLTTWYSLGWTKDGLARAEFGGDEITGTTFKRTCPYALPVLRYSRFLFEKCKETL